MHLLASRFVTGSVVCLVLMQVSKVVCTTETSVRRKRIVYGTPLPTEDTYDAAGYVVRIGMVSTLAWFWAQTFNLGPFTISDQVLQPKPPTLHCGGALLTPTVVQTACHCVAASWTIAQNLELTKYRYPIFKNGWEDLMVIHHGYMKVADMKDGVWSKKFIAHIECKKLKRTGDVSHDFAVILTSRLLPSLPWIKTNFAPVYTEKELALQYYGTLKREAVCLFLGYGVWYYIGSDFGEPSPILYHGWRVLMSYTECFYSDYLKFLSGNSTYLDYIRECTWACHRFFGKQRTMTGAGDSGSPITCSNEYFGINSNSFGILGITTAHNLESAASLAHAMFENAAEYREAMIARLMEFARSHELHPPDVVRLATINPYIAPWHIQPKTKTYAGIKNLAGCSCWTTFPVILLLMVNLFQLV